MADDTGEQLIRVAREILAKRGYLGLTMKTASAAAGVTPDVAMRYYRNRDALIAAALRLPSDPFAAIPTLVAPGVEGMGERLVRYMLDILRDPQTRDELVSLARTGVNAGHAMAGLQDFLERAIVDRVATTIGVPDARMRSALITSYLLGIAMTRYGVRLEPLASASEEDVVRMVAPVIQDLLDPRKPLPGSARARSSASGSAAPNSDPGARTRRTFDPDPKATAARAARQSAAGGAPVVPRAPSAKPAPAAAKAPTTPQERATAPGPARKGSTPPARVAAPQAPTAGKATRTTGRGAATDAGRGAATAAPRAAQRSGSSAASKKASAPGTSRSSAAPSGDPAADGRAKHAAPSGDDTGAGQRPERGT